MFTIDLCRVETSSQFEPPLWGALLPVKPFTQCSLGVKAWPIPSIMFAHSLMLIYPPPKLLVDLKYSGKDAVHIPLIGELVRSMPVQIPIVKMAAVHFDQTQRY